ncbi:hypothetical protein G5I_08695 [Acromyrmex echinatior]|uniref:Uncharacterized protein n=1 Tax=Acromyrmex echinatior TaxID=103372 RepID=F4WS79_ACREC|nr:hypothetical protein G5I_08695 [Acromyrmex echinatior]
MGQRPKVRYDTCSAGQCKRRSYFSVKELNLFDPGLDLVRSQLSPRYRVGSRGMANLKDSHRGVWLTSVAI